MRLQEYFETYAITPQELAEKCDITVQAISQYKLGKRRPHPDIAAKIVKATKGRVDYSDLYKPVS